MSQRQLQLRPVAGGSSLHHAENEAGSKHKTTLLVELLEYELVA